VRLEKIQKKALWRKQLIHQEEEAKKLAISIHNQKAKRFRP